MPIAGRTEMEHSPPTIDDIIMQRVSNDDPSVTDWNLRYRHTDAMLSALGCALVGNTNLDTLGLQNVCLGSEQVAQALAGGIARSSIRCIHLGGDFEHGPSEWMHIWDIVYRAIRASNTVQELHLRQCFGGDPGGAWRGALLSVEEIDVSFPNGGRPAHVQAFADVLVRSTSLQTLSLGLSSDTGVNSVAILANAIFRNRSLTHLVLTSGVPPDVSPLLQRGLGANSSIVHLNASSCEIDDRGLEMLLTLWLPNCRMESLRLTDNRIGAAGAQRLLRFLASYVHMSRLYLDDNHGIGHDGLRLIGMELSRQRRLALLDVRGCCDEGGGDGDEWDAAVEKASEALVSGIRQAHCLEDLRVSDNHLPVGTEDDVYFYGKRNTAWGLLVSRDPPPAALWCHVLAKWTVRFCFSTGPSLVFWQLREVPYLVRNRPPPAATEEEVGGWVG